MNNAAVFLFFLLPLRLFAATYGDPMLVDLEYAQGEISRLNDLIAEKETDSSGKEQIIEETDREISEHRSTLEKIEIHLDSLWETAGDLHGVTSETVDPKSRKRLLDEMLTNRTQRYQLNRIKAELLEKIADLTQSRYVANRQIAANTVNIRESGKRIQWLESCIALTETHFAEAGSIIEQSQNLTQVITGFLQNN